MIYNVPPICKKPVTVFDGIVRGNGELYAEKYQFTSTFKMQVRAGVTPRKLLADYAPGSGYTSFGQFNGYVQLHGDMSVYGSATGDGSNWNEWGIYVNNPVQLSGKKKLVVKAAHSYYNTGGGAVLTNDAPIRVCLFNNLYSKMFTSNALMAEVPSLPAFADGIFGYDKEIIIPDPEEIVFDVSNLYGEYYIGFLVDNSESSVHNYYYLNIGEIVAL